MKLMDAVSQYYDFRRIKGTLGEREKYAERRILDFFGDRDVSSITRPEVRSYITSRLADGVQLGTVRREIVFVRAVLNFLRYEVFERPDFRNPFDNLRLPKPQPRVRWITREEAERLIVEAERNARRPHLSIFITLALNTGCRRGELLDLEWSRVDLDRRFILLHPEHTKTRARRTAPLNDRAVHALGRMKHWQALNLAPGRRFVFAWERGVCRDFNTAWPNALRRAGIEDFHIHDLRHTFASWLVMNGVSLYVVKDLLGHACITQTQIYAHLAPSQGFEAVQQLHEAVAFA